MPNYDSPGVSYDSGLFYDDTGTPPTKQQPMAKVRLGLAALTPDAVVSLANQVKTAMTGNANFTTPNPTLVALGAAITTATAKVAAQKAAQLAAKQATEDRDTALTTLESLLNQEASYVENVTGGDPVKIASAGMSTKNPAAPVGALGQVQNLSLSAGDNAGRLDMNWDPVRGAKNYEVQSSIDPNTDANWKLIDTSSASKLTLTGLTSGQRVWIRVRAKAPKKVNDGAWSDPATKIVP